MSEKTPVNYPDSQETFEKWNVESSNTTSLQNLIQLCRKNQFLYKFISANDAGSTGSHQSGFYLPNSSWPFFFDSPGEKGSNKELPVTIHWESGDLDTNSRFKWYGGGTRREYRLTRFGRNFPFLKDDYIGTLLVLVKTEDHEFSGWILESDNDIEQFLARFNISHLDKGGILFPEKTEETGYVSENTLELQFEQVVRSLKTDFPETAELARTTRTICARHKLPKIADDRLTRWLDTEYQLYRLMENKIYDPFIRTGNHSLEDILAFCNSVLNRRKSRAGKSLEHHLAAIFDEHHIAYSHGEVTEGHSRPDFIFPGISQYHCHEFSKEHLVFLGSKTTCKDRWRQILTEAGRIENKHLFTLQPGISSNQLEEMSRSHVTLVVPKQNIASFPEPWRERLMTLDSFIHYVQATAG